MSQEMYRVCDNRKEAEGLLGAIRERFGERGTLIQMDESGRVSGLTHNLDDVVVKLRESNVKGKYQLFITCSHQGNLARVRAALGRRICPRIQWPPRAVA